MNAYIKLTFKKLISRPFFYASFVTTIDGKVWVDRPGYWPIGSKTDYETFTYLRAHADVIVDGRGTAMKFGKKTIDTLYGKTFNSLRNKLGKKQQIEYIILTSHHTPQLQKALENSYGYMPIIFRKGIKELIKYLKNKNYSYIFIDGGPHVFASFLKEHVVDELFITVAPKIFGNDKNKVITMVEGHLFPPKAILEWNLISFSSIENEIFLRYRNKRLTKSNV